MRTGAKKSRMTRQLGMVCLLMLVSSALSSSDAVQLGSMPVPVLNNATVQANATFDLGTQRYTYTYTVSNPATNTGEIYYFSLDLTTQIPPSFTPAFDASGLTIPVGDSGFKPFDQKLADMQPLLLPAGKHLIPFGQRVPSRWTGGLRRDGFASFGSRARPDRIKPGVTLGGFELISGGMPTIRKMEVEPFWIFTSPGDATPEEEQAAIAIEKSIVFHTLTLGPSAHAPGTFAHWDQVRDDLNQAIQLGWIPDVTLANNLVSRLASAREAFNATDGTLAKSRLDILIQTITTSTPAQRRREVLDLVLLNAQRLKEATPDTVFPIEPKLKLSPQSSTLPLGTLYTLTATVNNLGNPTNPPQTVFIAEWTPNLGTSPAASCGLPPTLVGVASAWTSGTVPAAQV